MQGTLDYTSEFELENDVRLGNELIQNIVGGKMLLEY